jgi:hypothetical protein
MQAGNAVNMPLAAPDILSDLWRRRLDTMISGISNGDPYYQQIANAAEHISAEYQGRFLIELIQNANDQAVRAGLFNSAVTVVRTTSLVAVGNSGQPFDADRVDAVTSIFKSDKAADECIGNKGIGFKAVFQVADSAEIFSSSPDSNLAEGCAIAFRMVRDPFTHVEFQNAIGDLARKLLGTYDERRVALEKRFPGMAAIDVVLREASRAAWFTFPLPATEQDLAERVIQLQLSAATLVRTQTLVVLPLRGSTDVVQRVDRAVDDVRGRDGVANLPPGATFLFLPGIAQLDVVDCARGFRVELQKTQMPATEELGNGVLLRRQLTTSKEHKLGSDPAGEDELRQDWWVAEKVIGAPTPADETIGLAERRALREAIESLRLPEANWKDVEQVPVTVAIPDPSRSDDAPATPLGAAGRFCIGLPSQVPTGSPLWLSSHFHGKIDRTAIDFDNAYNGLLFKAATELTAKLIGRLKAAPGLATRRLVTLALERSQGTLGEALYAPEGLAHTAVVLDSDGEFITPTELRMPKASDLAMFGQLVQGLPDFTAYGFRLPDQRLLTDARKILDELASGSEVDDVRYLDRPPRSLSLLEAATRTHRAAGPIFWEPFLRWILDRFCSKDLNLINAQCILPVGTDQLATPESRVFFPPMSAPRAADDKDSTKRSVDDFGEELASIDDTVLPLLRLFDESTIEVRTGTGREYRPLAQQLAPTAGAGLVRRPRQADLINDALIPALRSSKADNDRALVLLRQALVWLIGMPPKSKQRVSVDELLVPTRGRGEAWEWVEPGLAYLGPGWSDEPGIELLTKAYGHRDGVQLVPWDRFEKRLPKLPNAGNKEWWCEQVRSIGVWDCPRIIRAGERCAVGQSDSYSHLTAWIVRCPTPCVDGVWPKYLERISRRRANTKSGQVFYVDDVVWIDGLENPDIRTLLVEAMLRKPERYEAVTTNRLSRWNGEDSTDISSLWVHALAASDWPVMPTSHGPRVPRETWFLPLELRATKSDRFSLLPCVRAEFGSARKLFRAIDVLALEEAPVPRLVSALRHLAGQMPLATPESLRHIEAIAADLYEAIESRLQAGESADGLRPLVDGPVPLLRQDKIGCAALTSIDRLVIDDNPVRRRHLTGLDDAWVLPKRFQESYRQLAPALRSLIGDEKVVRVSECAIEVHFRPLGESLSVLDYLRDQFPGRGLAEEVALLIVKGGTQATSPYDPTFRESWLWIAKIRISRGEFGCDPSVRACFDAQHGDGPSLMVDSRLSPHEIVAELWQAVGPAYRDIWTAFGLALKENATDRFFRERGVSAAERTEVESAVGLGFEQRLRRFQPVCLAVWRSNHVGTSFDAFCLVWGRSSKTADAAAAWLSWDDLNDCVQLASLRDEPDGSLYLLGLRGVSVDQWQAARAELGEDPYRFAASEQAFKLATGAIAGHLAAWFAYLIVPRASGASGPTVAVSSGRSVAGWLEAIQAVSVPADIARAPLPTESINAGAAREALRLLDPSLATGELRLLAGPLEPLSHLAPADTSSIKIKDEPDKAARVYERDNEVTRGVQAAAAVDAVIRVAGPLATKHEEVLDEASLRADELVALLSDGRWANRVSVLAAIRFALEKATPKTATRMKDRQAFRDLDDWRVLWRKFEELGDVPKPAAPPLPKPKFGVLGSSWTEEEFRASGANGAEGELARQVLAAVDPTVDLAVFRSASRSKVQPKAPRTKGSGGGAGSRRRAPDEYLHMLGAIGEHFVYQQFRVILPDFDLTNWRSGMKHVFGYGDGDDSLGYDFDYHDVAGQLSGRPERPRCLIEVKSASEECGGLFDMSTNEWTVAQQCHARMIDAVYVIVRVSGTVSRPSIVDVLIDPIDLHLRGLLDYSSRDLRVEVGKRMA